MPQGAQGAEEALASSWARALNYSQRKDLELVLDLELSSDLDRDLSREVVTRTEIVDSRLRPGTRPQAWTQLTLRERKTESERRKQTDSRNKERKNKQGADPIFQVMPCYRGRQGVGRCGDIALTSERLDSAPQPGPLQAAARAIREI